MPEVKKFLGTTNTGDLSALGSDQQREFSNVKYLLNDDALVKYFAVPSKNEDNEKIDWFSDKEGQIKRFSKFNEDEVKEASQELEVLKAALQEKATSAKTPLDSSSILNLCTIPRIEESVLKVGDQLVLINWSYLLRAQKNKPQVVGDFGGLASTTTMLSKTKEQELAAPVDESLTEPASEGSVEPVHRHSVNPEYEDPVEAVHKHSVNLEDEDPAEPEGEIIVKPLGGSKQKIANGMNYWLWIAVFLLLLLINVMMLKDACGIKRIPFLDFC